MSSELPWPSEEGARAVAVIERRSGRYFAISEPAVQDGPDVEITPHCFRLIEAALQLWPGSPVDITGTNGLTWVPGAVSSRRIVSASSRRPGAEPKQGTVYRQRTAGIPPKVNRLCEQWMHARGPEKDSGEGAVRASAGGLAMSTGPSHHNEVRPGRGTGSKRRRPGR